MATKKTAKRAAPRKAAGTTTTDIREEAQVMLADLLRHVGSRQLTPDTPARLPTRLRKLEGIDDLPQPVAAAMLPAAGLWADLILDALDRGGFILERK